jgi:diacylglycerol O-acyltransferase / wax synthase
VTTRRRMTPVDAAWLRMDRPTNLMVITGLMWFDAPVDWARVRAVVADRFVARYPRFRQRVADPPFGLGTPYWEDCPDFDLEDHLEHVALPAPGDRDALARFVGERMSASLDRDRPLWRMWFVDGYADGAAIVTRLHHALADGISLARVLLSLTDAEDAAMPDRAAAPSDPAAAPSDPAVADPEPLAGRLVDLVGDVAGEAQALAADPARLVGATRWLMRAPGSLAKLVLSPPDVRTPLRGSLGGEKRVGWSDALPLARVRAIGRAVDATINDVLLTAVTGALGRLLAAHGSRPGALRAFVAVNLRPLDRPVPTTLGNRFGLVMLSLPVGLEDPHERLAELKRRMDAIKASPESLLAFGILGVLGATPAGLERLLVDAFGSKASVVMTNVPGPAAPLTLAGTRVAGLMAWVPQAGGIAVGVSLVSYRGAVTLGVAVDEQRLGAPEPLLTAFADELTALESLAR